MVSLKDLVQARSFSLGDPNARFATPPLNRQGSPPATSPSLPTRGRSVLSRKLGSEPLALK